MKTYIEEFLMTFSGFHQTVFSFLTAYRLQQLFPQLTAHSNFFHSHSPTKQTLSIVPSSEPKAGKEAPSMPSAAEVAEILKVMSDSPPFKLLRPLGS
jgi:hypothetical protein